MTIIFGTYNVSFDRVESQIKMSKDMGIAHYDTAQLYRNEKYVADYCDENDHVTTKIFSANNPNQLAKQIKRSIRRFGKKKITTMLLHRPMPNDCWKELCRYSEFNKIGISNYDYNGLVDLLNYCQKNNLKFPDVHQMEIHPFVDCIPLIEFCQEKGIRVEGHTVLTQTKFFEYIPLKILAEKYKVSPAIILISWALSKNIDVVINSSKEEHLRELLNPIEIEREDLNDIDSWHLHVEYRFYKKHNKVPHSLNGISNAEELIDQQVIQLKLDMESNYPSDLCEHLPLAGEGYRLVGRAIADKLNVPLNKYREIVKSLKTKRVKNKGIDLLHKKGLTCCAVRRITGPYSEMINEPRPMPVEITPPSEFKPIFNYLSSSLLPPQSDTIFVKGAIFPDGRMDLCKQVVGPTSIKELCEVVKRSKIVKHFLLGNNVALQEDEIEGAEAIASIMRDNEKKIETWYLAGNCINSEAIKIMAEALSHNNQCKALWLKRNPVGIMGALYLNSMLKLNRTLVLLDLHNCAIKDEGLINLLKDPEELQTLKHLYLDANGIEHIEPVTRMNKLKTLYLSINRLGDTQITILAKAFTNNQNLKRLCLASTHMKNEGLKAIVDMALTCPKLICLNLGCYKSSADLGENPGNLFDDNCVLDIIRLLNETKSLKYLNTAGSKMTEDIIRTIPRPSNISLDLGKGPWHHVQEKDQLRFAKQPKRVVHIDSIYRGQM